MCRRRESAQAEIVTSRSGRLTRLQDRAGFSGRGRGNRRSHGVFQVSRQHGADRCPPLCGRRSIHPLRRPGRYRMRPSSRRRPAPRWRSAACFALALLTSVAWACGDDGGETTSPAVPTPVTPSGCRVGQVLGPGESCPLASGAVFQARADGIACLGDGWCTDRLVSGIVSGISVSISPNSLQVESFRATRVDDTLTWRIDAL